LVEILGYSMMRMAMVMVMVNELDKDVDGTLYLMVNQQLMMSNRR
jgi:hypothetical protein